MLPFRLFLGSSPSRQVTYGADGTLFFTGEKAIEQSTGEIVRSKAMEQFANYLAEFNAEAREANSAKTNRLCSWYAARGHQDGARNPGF